MRRKGQLRLEGVPGAENEKMVKKQRFKLFERAEKLEARFHAAKHKLMKNGEYDKHWSEGANAELWAIRLAPFSMKVIRFCSDSQFQCAALTNPLI